MSSDMTAKIARTFRKVSVIDARKGKILALNDAIDSAKTEVIVINDADTFLEKGAIKMCVSRLGDSSIGGVTGFSVMKPSKNIYSKGKINYHKNDWNLRSSESDVDTCCGMDGKLIAFKKSVVPFISEDAYADDFEMTLAIRKKGLRCVVEKKAVLSETPPSDVSNEIKQMRRRTVLSILTIFRHRDMLFNPRYSYYGMLILPFRRLFPLFLPFMAAYAFLFLAFFHQIIFYIVTAISVLAAVLSSSVRYAAILMVSITLSWIDILKGRYSSGDVWEKIVRS